MIASQNIYCALCSVSSLSAPDFCPSFPSCKYSSVTPGLLLIPLNLTRAVNHDKKADASPGFLSRSSPVLEMFLATTCQGRPAGMGGTRHDNNVSNTYTGIHGYTHTFVQHSSGGSRDRCVRMNPPTAHCHCSYCDAALRG